MRAQDDQIEIIGVKKIDGPLAKTEHIEGNHICEVSLGSKCIGVSSMDNPGEVRSFPNPNGPAEQRTHFILQSPIMEFNVRVPSSELSLKKLSRLKIKLYRTKKVIEDPVGSGLVREQFSNYIRPVAEMKGIKIGKLSKKIQSKIKQNIK